jgi:Flp pilus assembly protein TadG
MRRRELKNWPRTSISRTESLRRKSKTFDRETTVRVSHVVKNQKQRRRGAAAVELATMLPVLVFWSMATVDFARLAYVQVTLQNCARNGALYEFYAKSGFSLPSGWTSLATAVQADEGSNLTVTATATSPASSTNNYVTVTATTTFSPIALPSMHGLPSIPGTVTLTQSVTMPFPASASPLP